MVVGRKFDDLIDGNFTFYLSVFFFFSFLSLLSL